MGGFEGGDEGGYWDVDVPVSNASRQTPNSSSYIEKNGDIYSIKAHSKLVNLYDTISFIPSSCQSFTIEGIEAIPFESSPIYQAYQAVLHYTQDSDIEDFFYEHKVLVTKDLPLDSDIKACESHAVAFIHLLKEVCNLVLRDDELLKILDR